VEYVNALERRLQRAEELLQVLLPGCDAESTLERLHDRSDTIGTGDQDKGELLSTIRGVGQLDLTETGESDYHGISSGAVFLSRMKEHFQGLKGYDYRIPFVTDTPENPLQLQLEVSLPPKNLAQTLCHYSFSCATCLLRVVHVPTFYDMVDSLYEESHDRRSLALFYAVLALGCMYNIDEEDPSNPSEYKSAMEQG